MSLKVEQRGNRQAPRVSKELAGVLEQLRVDRREEGLRMQAQRWPDRAKAASGQARVSRTGWGGTPAAGIRCGREILAPDG